MDYAKMLIEYRAKHNLSQQQLGDMLQVARLSIFKWERGEMPTRKNQMKIKMLEENKNEN